MTAVDDIEAYLLAFERTTEREGSILTQFLSGEPWKAYYDLEPTQASDSRKLKDEILERLGVTSAVHEVKSNTGCELSYKNDIIFKYKAIVFYSQRLIFNTLDDVKRLANQLTSFLNSCCSSHPNPDCFFSSDIIFQNRICEDRVSKCKNKHAAFCCHNDYFEREKCFHNLQNNPPLLLPSMGDHLNYEEECLAWVTDKHGFIESYLHGFGRRLTKFTPSLTTDIFNSFLIIYMKCCDHSEDIHLCFSEEKSKFFESMTSKIRLGNTMCLINKHWEGGLRALIFYAKVKPSDSIEKALDFDRNYMTLTSKCCEPGSLTSDCFKSWSDILLSHICFSMGSGLQKACCLKSYPERERCLTEIAYQESQTISRQSLEPNEVCQLSRNSKLRTWIAYEYSRRNPHGTIRSHLAFVTELTESTVSCCAKDNSSLCLTSFYKHFPV
ncbi:afamin-like [Spea bombifrons]|uniref:afamin-like n=1 Tax=Spea bombifrons TaxID=233779 RepID=UPI002348F196|nr:afamin-like [Spea bombifrons]